MEWFSRRKKRMEFIEGFVPTSKIQLKRICLAYHRGDTKKAQEMYDYYSKDIDLPDFDPVRPTTMEQVKSGAIGVVDFIKNNKDDILQGYNIIQYMFSHKGALPTIDQAPPATELPPINQ